MLSKAIPPRDKARPPVPLPRRRQRRRPPPGSLNAPLHSSRTARQALRAREAAGIRMDRRRVVACAARGEAGQEEEEESMLGTRIRPTCSYGRTASVSRDQVLLPSRQGCSKVYAVSSCRATIAAATEAGTAGSGRRDATNARRRNPIGGSTGVPLETRTADPQSSSRHRQAKEALAKSTKATRSERKEPSPSKVRRTPNRCFNCNAALPGSFCLYSWVARFAQ